MSLPNLNDTPSNRIHPALDFTPGHCYVGQKLPCIEPIENQETMLYLIRDDGTIIPSSEESLRRNNIDLMFANVSLKSKWSLSGLNRFIEGEETAEPNAIFNYVTDLFKTYVELPDERLYDFLTLWNIGTYFFPLFNAYPYVYVGGIRDSGKTKLLTLCQCISFNSIFSGNMTTACVFRLVQNGRCSLFIDETDILSTKNRGGVFRNILLNGYKKGLPVYRNRTTQDGNYVPESFEVYGPKMLANIEGLEDVLRSRCITIIMQRGLNSDITNREVDINDSMWQQTRDLMYLFLMGNWRDIKRTYSELENDTSLLNRNWELWKPMITLAKFFNNESNNLFQEMKDLAIEKATENQGDDLGSHEVVLAEFLLSEIDEDDYYRLGEIREGMTERLEYGRWVTPRYVGGLLRRLGFSRKRRVGTGYEYFLTVSGVRDCARRLGVSVDSEVSECSEGTTEQDTQVAPEQT